MPFKNFVTFLTVLRCEVAISWTFSGVFYAVVGPLGSGWEGAAVVKEFLVQLVGGGALVGGKRGRAAPLQTRTFDSTMGFPGEDVAAQTRL